MSSTLRAMPLISIPELARRLDEPNLVVVDCRWGLNNPEHGKNAYRTGHIPGAVFADLDTNLSGPAGAGRHPLPDPETFDRTLGSWGITPQSTVVAYDDAGGAIAARLWWMLTDQGHTDTFVLDGGITEWEATGHETAPGDPHWEATTPAGLATNAWRNIATIDDVAQRPASTILIDARSPERYQGVSEPIDARPGHIPGALNVPTSDNLEHGRFRPRHQLRNRYLESGVNESSRVIAHCGSGVTACHDILAMELAGLPRAKLYVGSWSEWASTDHPAATGNRP